jgi:LPS-assembly protein
MDVAFRATNVPLSRQLIKRLKWIGALALLLAPQVLLALGENKPIHFSGDKQVWNRKVNQVELFGHAAVNQVGETLFGDYIFLDMKARTLIAKGNCVYMASDATIWGDEMHFNLDTRTGTVKKGRVANDKFTLRGEEIHKLGYGRFQTQDGTYTTCRDCSASWTLEAENVDMQIEGYAHLSGVTSRIKDAPAFWLPYLVVPMKTRRQTGFLFPSFSASGANGPAFVLPFFWAINRSSDMTIAAGEYTQRGHRLEWEGRYALSPRSGGKANAYYLSDRKFDLVPHRWAVDIAQTQELPWGFDEKLRISEVSDNIYPFFFGTDLPGSGGEAFLKSSLIFSRGSSNVSGYLAFQRNRNLLYTAPNDPVAQQTQFDGRTVHALPAAVVTTNDKPIFGSPFYGGLTLGVTRFSRNTGPFDYDTSSVPFGDPVPFDPPQFRPGVDPIRSATRVSLTPSLYTSFRAFDVVSVVPSVQYRSYFYNFNNLVPNLNRGYLLFQTDLSSQIEKIYEYPNDDAIPRAKHLIRPLLTYSYIPYIREDESHPFVSQITNAQSRGIYGYNFDDYDIVPYGFNQSGANYFIPLGNSLAYGFTSQWIRRRSALFVDVPSYQTAVELSAGQAVNFLELSKKDDPHIFTRFFSTLGFNYDRFISKNTYYYYPDIAATTPRHTLSSSATLIFERSMHQRILTFDRSFTLGYTFNKVNAATSNLTGTTNFSLSDYVMPFGSISYGFRTSDAQPAQLYAAGTGVQLQSPSQCWKFITGINYGPATGVTWSFDLSLNLTGSGFGGVSEIAAQANTQTGR